MLLFFRYDNISGVIRRYLKTHHLNYQVVSSIYEILYVNSISK